jgi:hypothetical protein
VQIVYETETDPSSHFAPLFQLLEAVATMRDYNNPAIAELVASGAVSARRAGVRPESMIIHLRDRVHGAALAAVGDWYRGVLADRIVSQAVIAYFDAGTMTR